MRVNAEANQISLRQYTAGITIDQRGGVITSLMLPAEPCGKPHEVLYCDDRTLGTDKPRGTHFMMPVGDDGTGSKHGPVRRGNVMFGVHEALSGFDRQTLYMDGGPDRVFREIILGAASVKITTEIIPKDEPLARSIGEHFYFSLGGAPLDTVVIGKRPIEAVLGDEALNKISAGEPVLWSEYGGIGVFKFPHRDQLNGGIVISAGAEVAGSSLPPNDHGMLFWREPPGVDGKAPDYLCMEPVVGLTERDGVLVNNGLLMPLGRTTTHNLVITAPNFPRKS